MSLTKIPTELYICVPKRSSASTRLYTNIWGNLTRKDTGQGISGKYVLSYLDDVHISQQPTGRMGAVSEYDINPTTEGLHRTWLEFKGDAEFEPCKSEEIVLKCDPNLTLDRIAMQVAPISGNAPLTIHVSGVFYERYLDQLNNPADRPPEYAVPIDLMVLDRTSITVLQAVKTGVYMMCNPDGTFAMDYAFTKPGSYRLFVNFLGDNKYTSAWSNNGQTTQINVLEGGELPLSFDKIVTEVVAAKGPRNYKFIRAETEPDAPDGYERAPEWDLDFGILGKYWAFREAVA